MLQVARLAPKLLGESSALVKYFLLRQQNEDGGFKDRNGTSDLYYTVFGLDGLIALQADLESDAEAASELSTTVEKARRFLSTFGAGSDLDFVHLCCLARGWTAVANLTHERADLSPIREPLLRRIEAFRSQDGGYHPIAGSAAGTAYGAFLAFGARQDLGADLAEPLRLIQSLKFLETPDGAWANERGVPIGATNSTAAAVTVLRHLGMPINSSVGDWLLARCSSEGGFLAVPGAPLPDLLSTATALHALSGLQLSFDPVREKCLDFVDTLWTNEGAFHGHWADDHLDCEYTYYGLLALGHLSV
jgi:prenyltransferase beta subunit